MPSLFHITRGTTDTADWTSAANLPGELTASNQAGMALNVQKNKLAYAGSAYLRVFDISGFPAVTRQYEATTANGLYSGATSRDAAFDAAGNVYATNSSAERLRVYSPGGGANSYESASPSSQSLVVGSGVNEWLHY